MGGKFGCWCPPPPKPPPLWEKKTVAHPHKKKRASEPPESECLSRIGIFVNVRAMLLAPRVSALPSLTLSIVIFQDVSTAKAEDGRNEEDRKDAGGTAER